MFETKNLKDKLQACEKLDFTIVLFMREHDIVCILNVNAFLIMCI